MHTEATEARFCGCLCHCIGHSTTWESYLFVVKSAGKKQWLRVIRFTEGLIAGHTECLWFKLILCMWSHSGQWFWFISLDILTVQVYLWNLWPGKRFYGAPLSFQFFWEKSNLLNIQCFIGPQVILPDKSANSGKSRKVIKT